MLHLAVFILTAGGALQGAPNASIAPVADTPFIQEHREFFVGESGAAEHGAAECGANDVRAIAIDSAGRAWLATMGGIYAISEGAWRSAMAQADLGPAYASAVDREGGVWLGAWNGLYRVEADGALARIPAIGDAIAVVAATSKGIVAFGPGGMWHERNGAWKHVRGAWASSPRAVAEDADGTLWLATGHGLYHINDTEVIGHLNDEDVLYSGDVRDIAVAPDGRIWIAELGAIEVLAGAKIVKTYLTRDGLAHGDVRSVAVRPDGMLWLGTACGAQRFDGTTWSLRHSLRWLPSDDVRDVAFDKEGAAWVATGGGVGVIKRRTMTLEEKAANFDEIVLARKMREPGLVEKSRLLTPGDPRTSTFEDDDNDGQYTNMYLAAEAFRYQVTKDPKARANAQKAFDAIEFLQHVTGTKGFIARTVVPTWWADPKRNDNPFRLHDANRTYTPQEIATMGVMDPRDKVVEVRWRPSADGQWLWKGDTSSDEMTGHFYGLLHYYDLVAESEADRERARALARRLMDHIIDGGFVLKDIDGKHTRWGVWAPERLLHDPDWQAERGINATEILSFLKTTYYLTGEAKYQRLYRQLIDEHGYAELARKPKPTGRSVRTHIDAELLALTLVALVRLEDDPALRALYDEGVREWFAQTASEHSALFSFTAGLLGIQACDAEMSVAFLRDAPLDNVHWTIDNTKREDIRLVREPELEPLQTDRLLPPSERDIVRWDNNPWSAVGGQDGCTEGSTVYWLLPYWMGRYYGFISPPRLARPPR